MKTLIAIPCMDTVPVGFAESILNLQKPAQTAVCFHNGSLVYDSRNLLALTAIENNFDRVLWLDSDMVIPMNALVKLSDDMDKLGCDMVSGIYFKRKPDTEPVFFRRIDEPAVVNGKVQRRIDPYLDYPQDNLFKIDGCGFGCVMMNTSLLKEVWDKFQNAFLPFPWAGEDISFCYRVKLLGHNIWCDPSISCGHIGQYTYNEQTFRNRGDAS